MIPKFPKLKKLEFSDRREIERFTLKYEPYSDFNFTSMWSWNIADKMKVATLNGNLVVLFSDYITGELFFGFLGVNKINDTINKIIRYALKHQIDPVLKLIPEISIKKIKKKNLLIEEDRNNFDYLYDTYLITRYHGNSFETKRNMVNRLLRYDHDIYSQFIELDDKSVQKEILEVVNIWEKNKLESYKSVEKRNELLALHRLFDVIDKMNLVGVGIYSHNKLVAFSINELLQLNYAVTHFAKSDINLPGIYEYLMRETNKILLDHGRMILDFEQDLGLANLRCSKESFRPISFLKKYIVSNVDIDK